MRFLALPEAAAPRPDGPYGKRRELLITLGVIQE